MLTMVRTTFKIKGKIVHGCQVFDGIIKKDMPLYLYRIGPFESVQREPFSIKHLYHFKEEIERMGTGGEFGMVPVEPIKIKAGDIIADY